MSNFFINLKRRFYLKKIRFRLKNRDFTLLCNNCVAGAIYHQLGLQFRSPTINLFMSDEDFLYFCLHLNDYSNYELIEKNSDTYPVGELISTDQKLRPITVHFMHYASFEEAKEVWHNRMRRIKYDNIFVLFDVCNNTDIEDYIISLYNRVKYRKLLIYRKTIISNQKLPIDSFGINFGDEYHVAKILDNNRGGGQYFNQFDFVKWFNGK